MTQRIFDIENEKDMQDLWSILPDDVFKITKQTYNDTYDLLWYNNGETSKSLFGINWHDKTEITRPTQEATEQEFIEKYIAPADDWTKSLIKVGGK